MGSVNGKKKNINIQMGDSIINNILSEIMIYVLIFQQSNF